MRNGVCGVALVGVLAVVVPALAADKKTDKPASREKLVASGALEGTLTKLETTTKDFSLRVTQKVSVPNAQAQQNLQNLRVQLAQQASNRNLADRAQQIANIQREIQKNQANMVSYQDKHQDFDLQTGDTVKVRQAHPPVEFDDKGRPKKYTQKELAKLRGPDRKVPGYPAEFDNLKVGQKVKVWLSKPKTTGKTADKDSDKEAAPRRLTVTFILIQEEAPTK
jgi:hypothetical protein